MAAGLLDKAGQAVQGHQAPPALQGGAQRARAAPHGWRRAAWVTGAALLGGCAVNPPLLFGDSVTFGLQLGTAVAGSGGSVSLGYRQRSVAVVPVSVLDHNGTATQMTACVDDDPHVDTCKPQRLREGEVPPRRRQDAFSVFAVFETTANRKSNGTAKPEGLDVGQVFSTGMAAQHLTAGYACRLGDTYHCPDEVRQRQQAAASAAASAAAPASAAASRPSSPELVAAPASGTASGRPYQFPLVYGRTDSVGLDIGGSTAEQGVAFIFGYGSRNLALVPVHIESARRDGEGGMFKLTGNDRDPARRSEDAFSVLGQFSGNTQLGDLGLALNRYFSTGVAAQNLGAGIAAMVAQSKASAAAPSSPAASSPPGQ